MWAVIGADSIVEGDIGQELVGDGQGRLDVAAEGQGPRLAGADAVAIEAGTGLADPGGLRVALGRLVIAAEVQLDEGLDTGPVLARWRTSIGADESGGALT